ncbi:hypothetical protein [Actinoplanes sp. NPDC051859]|uniref:hypothetical protein n=1 Tax=Actinoplanes sp. NPDC051859 TaxID=3363909 RepID=UPI0037AF92E4
MPFRDRLRAVRRVVPAVLLPLLATPLLAACSGQEAGPPTAPGPAAAEGGYSLAATVSPAALTREACTADPTCIVGPAPAAKSKKNYERLQHSIDDARVLTGLDEEGKGSSAVGVTVFLPAGEWLINKGLRLPPYVSLRGAGITATVLRMDPSTPANWNYSTIVRHNDVNAPGSTQLVSDLTVNGNCRTGAGAPIPTDLPKRPAKDCDFRDLPDAGTNTGGGISVGDGWTVRQVRVTNVEYFKMWVHSAKNVHIVDNRFDNWGGAESGDEDNIGGGGRNENVVIEHNQFDETIRGNGIDFTNAIRPTIRYNTIYTNPTVAAARKIGDYGTIYLEGVPEATITDNLLYGAHIVLQSNGKYDPVGSNKDITNPRAALIAGNRIIDSYGPGVTITYDDYFTGDPDHPRWGTLKGWKDISKAGENHYVRPGGANVVRDNLIVRPTESGIVIAGQLDRVKNAPDTITGNTISNAGAHGSTAYSTGGGTFDTSGIAIGIGSGDTIFGNTITDTLDDRHPRHTTWYGVQLGARSAKSTLRNTILTGPTGTPNTATGLLGYLTRHGLAAPYAPLTPALKDGTLTWDESYVQPDIAIAGYKVFRDGQEIANLPTGSETIPGNLVSAADSSLETADVSAYTPGAGTTVTHYTGAGAVGTSSLALTATADGPVSAAGPPIPVTAGRTYTAVASYQALVGQGQRAQTGMEFYDADNNCIARVTTGNPDAVETARNWITSTDSHTAPPGSVRAAPFISVDHTTTGDIHLVDRIGLVAGTTRTEQFTDPTAPARATYHILAYSQAGEYGSTATITGAG